MPFTPDDTRRIRKYLQLPRGYKTLLTTQMEVIKEEDEIADIQAMLTELDTLEQKAANLATDNSSRLIRADVLEWEAGGRLAALQTRQAELHQHLVNALGLEGLVDRGKTGIARLYRS